MARETSALQREIRQNRPFSSLHQEATLGVLRTADLLRRRISGVVERYGVTIQQFNVLRILRGAGGPLPTLEIGERMVEQAPGVTRLLDRIEAKGWVTRQRCTEDRRQVLVSITPAGLELLAEMDDTVNGEDADALAMLDEAETERLIELLDRIRAGLG
jgi:DNA-binding MarR family transcriptional regulator